MFEVERPRLRGLAYRMLGSLADAEDVVQEVWLRLNRIATGRDPIVIENLSGWLTTVATRLALDMLRARMRRAEEPLETAPDGRPVAVEGMAIDPEAEMILAEQVGPALLVVLNRLAPSERIAFVLHDILGLPFEQVAVILGRTSAAVRQVASRARRRVRIEPTDDGGPTSQRRVREVVRSFSEAARAGDVAALIRLFDPDVTLSLDPTRIPTGATAQIRGAKDVAERARLGAMGRSGHLVLVDGRPALAIAPGGRLQMVMLFDVAGDQIVRIEIVSDAGRLNALPLTLIAGV